MKPIAAEFGAARSAPALAVALTFIGAGCGGIAMGWLAERIGVRAVVIFGGTMIGTGLTISSLGDLTQLYISSFLLVESAWRIRDVRAADDVCQPLVSTVAVAPPSH